jgi:DNA-directed RNA polymerase subunit RPC12/RpoP
MLFKVKYAIPGFDHIQEFYLKTCCFYDATDEATEHIVETVGEEYELLSIKAILNFVEKEEEAPFNPNKPHCNECDANYEGHASCPFCSKKDCDPKLLLKFACDKCKEEIEVLNNEWSAIFCPKCGNKIKKADVLSKKHQ